MIRLKNKKECVAECGESAILSTKQGSSLPLRHEPFAMYLKRKQMVHGSGSWRSHIVSVNGSCPVPEERSDDWYRANIQSLQ